MKLEELDRDITQIILGGESDVQVFNHLALEVFRFQYEHNIQYREHCLKYGVDVDRLDQLTQIPVVSAAVFKEESSWISVPEEKKGAYLATSGTSTGNPGRIYRDVGFFTLREKAIHWLGRKIMFARYQPERVRIVFLDRPNRRNLPNFKMDWSVLWTIKYLFGTDDSIFLDWDNDGPENLTQIIYEHQSPGRPLVIFGPSYRISRFITDTRVSNLSLPVGSMVMDSGGLKGKGGNETMGEYQRELLRFFGLKRYDYLNTYALSECGSQFPDNLSMQSEREIAKTNLPWAKARVIKNVNREIVDCHVGQIGGLIIYDLLNRGSVIAIATEDMAIRTNHGFQIIGRSD